MPPSEPSGTARLLRDVGNASIRTASGDTREHELLRLASDPLLLNTFVRRDSTATGVQTHQRQISAGLVLKFQETPRYHPSSRRSEFDAAGRSGAASVRPEIFLPSADDRALTPEAALGDVADHPYGINGMAAVVLLILCASLLVALI